MQNTPYQLSGVIELNHWSALRIPAGLIVCIVTFVVTWVAGLLLVPHVQLLLMAVVSMFIAMAVTNRVVTLLPTPSSVSVVLGASEVCVRRKGSDQRFANAQLTQTGSGLTHLEVQTTDGATHRLPKVVDVGMLAEVAARRFAPWS